jgi:hypothetical protein
MECCVTNDYTDTSGEGHEGGEDTEQKGQLLSHPIRKHGSTIHCVQTYFKMMY